MRTQGASGHLLALTWILAAGSGVVWSPTARADAIIQACYHKENGQLRILLKGECKREEKPVSWNMQGPMGSQGSQGVPGVPGMQGVPGAAGVSGLERVDFSSTADSDSPKKAFAKCPTGKKVMGGGAQVFIAGAPDGPVAVKASFPSDALDGWAATAEEMVPIDAKWFVTTFALCAAVTP